MEINKDNNESRDSVRPPDTSASGRRSIPGSPDAQKHHSDGSAAPTGAAAPANRGRAVPSGGRAVPTAGRAAQAANRASAPSTSAGGAGGARDMHGAGSARDVHGAGGTRDINSAARRTDGGQTAGQADAQANAHAVGQRPQGRSIPGAQRNYSAAPRPNSGASPSDSISSADGARPSYVRSAPRRAARDGVPTEANNPNNTPDAANSRAPEEANSSMGRQNASPRNVAAQSAMSHRPSQSADGNENPAQGEGRATPDKNRVSALRPSSAVNDAGATRVIPAAGRGGAANAGKKDGVKPKKKPKNASLRERLREEGNNAVLSLVKAAVYLICVILVSTIISVTVIMVGNDIFAFVKSDEKITVVIPENPDIDTISDILAENGIIKYPSVFRWYISDKDKNYGSNAGVFVAGTYELSPSMDYEDLLASFKPKKPSGTSWVTIPEGYTTDEIIDLLIEKGVGVSDGYSSLRAAYEDVINNYDFDYWFIDELEEKGISKDRIYRLDGYLFPDTYEFYNASKPSTVINKMLYRFNEIFTEEYRELAGQSGYTVDEIVTIASMVEKEANNPADYFNVSEVFRNRLANPGAYPALESDATVLYYLHHTTGERPSKTTPEDTKLEVPYNTYIYPGLPPGAISNPSATAILAALNPSQNGYYFFVSSDTETYFSQTYDQHMYYINLIASGMG